MTSRVRAWRRCAAPLLLVVGVLLLIEVAVTLVWQEPVTALSSRGEQDDVACAPHRPESAALAAPTGFAAGRGSGRAAVLARRYQRQATPGEPLGRIHIPRLDMNMVFVQGVSGDALNKGPGHYLPTALPGERGTVGIAGHRTTYLAPFRHIDELRHGDEIVLRMPYGRSATESRARSSSRLRTAPRCAAHDTAVWRSRTCTPPFSAAKRLIFRDCQRLHSSRLV